MVCHAAYQLASVGVTPCALNTSQAIGTSIPVTFTVFDNGVPPLSATVTRTLLITAPCPTGQYYCSGVCQQISCAASAALAAAAVTPVITLTSIPTAVLGSTSGGSAGIPYGTAPAFSLTPCTSYSKFHCYRHMRTCKQLCTYHGSRVMTASNVCICQQDHHC